MPKETRSKLTPDEMQTIDRLWQTHSDLYIAMLIDRHNSIVHRYRIKMGYFHDGDKSSHEHMKNEEVAYDPSKVFSVLNINQLKEYWQLFRKGVKKKQMCEHFKITEAECLQALEVVNTFFGKGPYTSMQQKRRGMVTESNNAPEDNNPEKVVRSRPPAVYSNRSPYGVASPGMV